MSATSHLTPTQEASVAWLADHPRGLLIGGMGSGKTRTTLTALAAAHAPLPALVVAPAAVTEGTWSGEARRISSPLLVEECPRGRGAESRHRVMDGPADVVVVSSACLADALDHEWGTVVVDEASMYRTPSSARSRTLLRLASRARGLWLLTGTPGDDPIGVWTLIRYLDGGERLGRRVTAARDRWLTPGRRLPSGAVIDRRPLPGAIEEITRLASDLVHVVPADDGLVIPGLDVVEVSTAMPAGDSRALRELRRRGLTTYDGTELLPASAGVAAQLAVQLTTGACWDPEVPDRLLCEGPRPSLDVAAERAAAGHEEMGGGVLVEYWYRHEEEDLAVRLGAYGLRVGRARLARDRSRWDAGDVDALLAHPASTGHGLNLQAGGSRMVWSCLPWSLELWEQACARLARPGQAAETVRCEVVVPTLDDGSSSPTRDVLAALAGKRDVQDEVIEGLMRDE